LVRICRDKNNRAEPVDMTTPIGHQKVTSGLLPKGRSSRTDPNPQQRRNCALAARETRPSARARGGFDRCGVLNCRSSTLAPIERFDPNGELQIKFGGA
jgi:hypothetical protein